MSWTISILSRTKIFCPGRWTRHLNKNFLAQVPQWLRELYHEQTNQEAPETVFRLPGEHVGASNTARTYVGQQMSGCGSSKKACLLGFRLNQQTFAKARTFLILWNPNEEGFGNDWIILNGNCS